MPLAECVQKEATKKLQKLDQVSGQTKISGFFTIGIPQTINEEEFITTDNQAKESEGLSERSTEQTESFSIIVKNVLLFAASALHSGNHVITRQLFIVL